MALQFRKAVRKSSPMLISVSGVSGSGKTFSSLLLAAGIAGPGGSVGLIDCENGRGELYADSPGIVAALPDGYLHGRIDPPFSPRAYLEAIKAAEDAGITVCIVDSGSHEWEGSGGCCDIAEQNKMGEMPNWAKAKMEHKRFLYTCLSSSMHLIFCLRAREKVKIVEINKRTEIVPIGIQAIAEKGFVFEMLVSLRVEEENHHAIAVKVPEPLAGLFPKDAIITKELGERIREWNHAGAAPRVMESLEADAKAAAELGTTTYRTFFRDLPRDQKEQLQNGIHEELKLLAEQATTNSEKENQ